MKWENAERFNNAFRGPRGREGKRQDICEPTGEREKIRCSPAYHTAGSRNVTYCNNEPTGYCASQLTRVMRREMGLDERVEVDERKIERVEQWDGGSWTDRDRWFILRGIRWGLWDLCGKVLGRREHLGGDVVESVWLVFNFFGDNDFLWLGKSGFLKLFLGLDKLESGKGGHVKVLVMLAWVACTCVRKVFVANKTS